MGSKPADLNEIEALRRQLAEVQARLTAAEQATGKRSGTVDSDMKTIATHGGAVVQHSVRAGGHFIGRDFIQIITAAIHQGDDPEEAKSVVAHYLEALVSDLAGLKLGEIDVSAKETKREPLQLADVFVPLNTHLRIPEDMSLMQWLSRDSRSEHDDMDTQRNTRSVSSLEALAQHRELTVLGKPGSGKSTFGASVLLTLAQVWQGHGDELLRLGERWTHGALLPIRVILRGFADQLPVGRAPARAGDLWAFIRHDLEVSGHGLSSDTMMYIQSIARTHGALILLDGLDECGNTAIRARVLNAVKEMIRTAGSKCRFLLTARPYAWSAGPDPAQGVYALADLSDEQIEHFIQLWYAALVRRKWHSPGEADRKMADLLDARNRPDLQPLAQNPLLLTLMATLHANRGRLPDDRADLYNESVDLLMLRWNRHIGADKALLEELAIPSLKLSDLREVLEELAFNVHEDNVAKGSRADEAQPNDMADIGEDRLVRTFRPLLNNSKDKADVVVDYIEKRAGLLIGTGEKDGERKFAFPHRTFQEFLAACHLAAQDDFPAECVRLARTAAGHWQVVLPLAARMARVERGASAADELVGGLSIADFRARGTPDAGDWTNALLAGMQLQEIGLGAINKRERTRAIARRVADWLVAALPVRPDEGGASAFQRAQAGDVLATLGDPRFNPQRFYLPSEDSLGFVRIPADPKFRIGTGMADAKRVAEILGTDVPDNEINDEPTPTPEFWVARYPVTVAQFRCFVENTQFELGEKDALRDPDTRPVTWVSWREALAYCDWLNEVLTTAEVFIGCELSYHMRTAGWRASLPSELEWEKAARGGLQDTVYSWGDDLTANLSNYDGTNINDTSPVGCFPQNGFGLYDMIGNVWELTRSHYQTSRYRIEDRQDPREHEDVYRVARGGSWLSNSSNARCASRKGYRPEYRDLHLGFRVVLGPHIIR